MIQVDLPTTTIKGPSGRYAIRRWLTLDYCGWKISSATMDFQGKVRRSIPCDVELSVSPLIGIVDDLKSRPTRRPRMKTSTIIYRNKPVYVGMDVHKKNFVIAVWFEGQLTKKASMPADGQALADSLRRWFDGAVIHTVYEAGFSGFGLHRILVKNGIDNIVINPSSVELAASDKKKNDKRDARKMAAQLAAGRLKGIHIPSPEEELRRQITRTRDQIAKSRVRVANMIKSKLYYFGYIDPSDDRNVNRKSYIDWVDTLDLPKELRIALGYLIEQWKIFTKQIQNLSIDIQEQALECPEIESVYRSVPGVGPLAAAILTNELGDLSKRFSSQKGLYQFTGLTPAEYSSGENVRKGEIDRQGPPRIRHLLVQISWMAIKKDGALMECFERVAAHRGKKRAIVAIARKIIGRMRACFATQTPYELGLVA